MKQFRETIVVFILGMSCCFVMACGSAENKASSLYDIAAFEEQQFNQPHAIQLYQQIVDQYPQSPQALQAREALQRLQALPPQ